MGFLPLPDTNHPNCYEIINSILKQQQKTIPNSNSLIFLNLSIEWYHVGTWSQIMQLWYLNGKASIYVFGFVHIIMQWINNRLAWMKNTYWMTRRSKRENSHGPPTQNRSIMQFLYHPIKPNNYVITQPSTRNDWPISMQKKTAKTSAATDSVTIRMPAFK